MLVMSDIKKQTQRGTNSSDILRIKTINTCISLSAVKYRYPLNLSVLIYSLYESDEILNKCLIAA